MKAYMGLKCKPGSYNEVMKKLLFGLHIDQQDVSLLFGAMDILIQFRNLRDLPEFIDKWFNPIRLIGQEEELITKTLSLIVISEGLKLSDRPFAFIFLNTKPSSVQPVQTRLLKFPEVLSADWVFGPYSIICSVKAEGPEELETLVLLIEQIPGIEAVTTHLISPLKFMPDW